MTSIASDKFQGVCMANEDGAGKNYMDVYDEFPKEIRDRLKHSPFNLCAACLFSYKAEIINSRVDYFHRTLGVSPDFRPVERINRRNRRLR